MSITIKRAKIEELEAIIQGQKESFYDCYQRYQDHEMSPYNMTLDMMKWILENEHLYRIQYDGKPVGAVYVHEEQDKYHMKLHGIFVVPEYQDKGIGQDAIALVEKEYPEVLTWALETPHDLYRNHHVYEKIGYVRTGREDFVNERLTIVHYKKEVKG